MNTTALYENLKSPIDSFYHWEKETPKQNFLRQPIGDTWKILSFEEAGQEARKMVTALQSMGLKKGDHIGILSKSCYHWILSDLAIMMGGFVSVPFYASLPKGSLKEVIVMSDIKALFVGKLDKWGDKSASIPKDVQVIRYPQYEGNAIIDIGTAWNDLIDSHPPVTGNYHPDHDDLWTILFTSGTTGSPKGVMHRFKTPALIMRGDELTNFLGIYKLKKPKYFSFLPLNHVAERIAVESSALTLGGCISFAESIDTFAKNLQETQPTILFAVPRIWMKFYLGVLSKMPQKKLDRLLKIPIVSTLVKKKIRTALGLRDAKMVATGAAITPEFLKDWYRKLDIHLIEAYGMTEVCGSITNSPNPNSPPDSVGEVIPFGEIKIHPESGEILMKSPHVMLGYYKEPEKTAEVLVDGWIHSGDRGTIDENGYLRVIGRVKDAFKTSKGSYITPNPLEEVLAKNNYLEQVCVAGLGCPQPIALANLSDIGMAASKDEVERSLKEALTKVNTGLASYHKVSTIVIDQTLWTEENHMLTPTMKVRRPKLDEEYQREYTNWHEADSKVIWK